MSNRNEDHFIDPDPYSVVAVWLAAATFVLQFVQFLTDTAQRTKDETREVGGAAALTNIENTIEELERDLASVARSIERGSSDGDTEFYNAKVGLGLSSMKLERVHYDAFTQTLSRAYGTVGAVGLWTAQLLKISPNTSARLGDHLQSDLGDASLRINELVRGGASNALVIAECRRVLEKCRIAVGLMLADRRSN